MHSQAIYQLLFQYSNCIGRILFKIALVTTSFKCFNTPIVSVELKKTEELGYTKDKFQYSNCIGRILS